MTALVGREHVLAPVVRQLSLVWDGDRSAPVTVTGLPGSGRSTLAAAVAERLTSAGAVAATVFVGLRGVGDPLSAIDRVVAALPGDGLSVTLPEAMWEAYGGAPVLIVLEDVDRVDGLGPVLQELAAGYPAAAVLCTSSRPGGFSGERVVRTRPLPLPDDDAPADHPALVLFADLAAEQGALLDLGDARVRSDVAAICRRAGGLPGAMSLLAARLGEVPLEIMASDDGTQHEVASTLEWTVALLAAQTQRALAALSVFQGPFLLDAAAAVVELEPGSDVADVLAELVDAHLVSLDPAGAGEPRFGLHQMVRDLARRLLDGDQRTRVTDRHARYFSSRGMAGPDVVRQEWPDIVAALDHEMANGRFDDALAAAVALAPEVQQVPGAKASLEQRIGELLERGEHVPAALQARALMWSDRNHPDGAAADVQSFGLWTAQRLAEATTLARQSGDGPALLEVLERTILLLRITLDLHTAVAAAHEGHELAQRLGDQPAVARFECYLSMAAWTEGDVARSARLATSGLIRGREHDDAFAQVAGAQLLLSFPPELRPELDPPLPTLEELLEQCEQLEQPFTGMLVLATLAHDRLDHGDVRGASGWLWRLLMVAANRQRTEPTATLGAVAMLLSTALAAGEDEDAARLREYVRPLEFFVPYVLPQPSLPRYLADAARLDSTFSEERRLELGSEMEAKGMSGVNRWAQELARRLAAHEPPQPTAHDAGAGGPVALTPREHQVLVALATGRTNREIADLLGLSAKTVMHHSVAIYRKLGVRGRAGATAWAVAHGLIPAVTPGRRASSPPRPAAP